MSATMPDAKARHQKRDGSIVVPHLTTHRSEVIYRAKATRAPFPPSRSAFTTPRSSPAAANNWHRP